MKHGQSKALTNYGTYWAAALGTLVCLPVLEKPLCHKHFSVMVGGAIVFAGFPSYFAAYWEKGVLWKQWERNTSCKCYWQRAISQIQGWKSFPSPPVLLIKDELCHAAKYLWCSHAAILLNFCNSHFKLTVLVNLWILIWSSVPALMAIPHAAAFFLALCAIALAVGMGRCSYVPTCYICMAFSCFNIEGISSFPGWFLPS